MISFLNQLLVIVFAVLCLQTTNAQKDFELSTSFEQKVLDLCLSENGELFYTILYKDTFVGNIRYRAQTILFAGGEAVELPNCQNIKFFDRDYIFVSEPHYESGRTIIKYRVQQKKIERICSYESRDYDRLITVIKHDNQYRVFIHGVGEGGHCENILLSDNLQEMFVYRPNGDSCFGEEVFGISGRYIVTLTAPAFNSVQHIGQVIDCLTGTISSKVVLNLEKNLYKKMFCGDQKILLFTAIDEQSSITMFDLNINIVFNVKEGAPLEPTQAVYDRNKKRFLFSCRNGKIFQIKEEDKYVSGYLKEDGEVWTDQRSGFKPAQENNTVIIFLKNKNVLFYLNNKDKPVKIGETDKEIPSSISVTKNGFFLLQDKKIYFYDNQ